MAKARFFRVATEGATTDGRSIERAHIQQMADNYSQTTLAARLNVEHIRGVSPDSAFGSYGDVLSLKTEQVQLKVGDKMETRLALYAEIKPLDNLLALSKSGQKLYTSIEINPNFAGTGKAYLAAIALTDNPASLGTEMLQFCAGKGAASPLAHRKQQPENLFTAAEEIALDFTDEKQNGSDSFSAFFAAFKALFTAHDQAAPAPVAPAPASGGAGAGNDAGSKFTPDALGAALLTFTEATSKAVEGLEAKNGDTAAQLAEIKSAMERMAPHSFTARPPATGADNVERADC